MSKETYLCEHAGDCPDKDCTHITPHSPVEVCDEHHLFKCHDRSSFCSIKGYGMCVPVKED
jgi:hypothetical protein